MNQQRKDFLKQLKAYGLEQNIPNVTELNGRFLHFLVGLKKPQRFLEIGTANGYSTIWIADALELYGGRHTGVDVSEPSFNQALDNLEQTGLRHICDMHLGDAVEWLENYDGLKFDMVFIDARKAYYHTFLELVLGMVTDEALIVVDDVTKFPEKTQPFHDMVAGMSDWESVILPIDADDGVMLLKKA